MRRRLVVLVALVALLGSSALAIAAGPNAAPAGASNSPGFSVYKSGTLSTYEAFEKWVPRKLDIAKQHFIKTNGWSAWTSPGWLSSFKAYRVSINVMPFPNDVGGSLAAAARGDYDAHYVTAARNLISNGYADAHIVLGHEFNGDWFPWTATGGKHTDFVDAYRRIVTIFRAQAGANFKFDWVLAKGRQQMNDPTLAYPGDAYVDVIGMDVYDQDWEFKPSQGGDWYVKRWNKFLTEPYGLNWLASFAASRGKPISFPEWGLTTTDSHVNAGGDNPYYVEKFHQWVHDNNVAYHAYHNTNWVDGNHLLEGGNFPNAAARFQALFTGTGTTTTTLAATTTLAPTTTTTLAPTTTTTLAPQPRSTPGNGKGHGKGGSKVSTKDASSGYWTVTAAGVVQPYGPAVHHGDLAGIPGRMPAVGIAATPSGKGYWIATLDGGVFAFGDARYFGSMGGQQLNAPVIDIDATPTGKGYVLLGADGGIFTFGDAQFFGSTGSIALRAPIVDFQLTSGGDGYWLVASDGGVFSFGSASFMGSAASIALQHSIVAMTAGGSGYWLVAGDGGVFSFGVPFHGSLAGLAAADTMRMGAFSDASGYYLVTADGTVYGYGTASAAPSVTAASTVTGFAFS